MMKMTIAAVIFYFSASFLTYAAFSPGLTRVIYDEEGKEASITVNSTNDGEHYLVQAWTTTVDNQRAEFMVTPPISKLPPDSQNTLRMRYIGQKLAGDRETLFFLNIKAIPSKLSSDESQITFSSKSVMKLFYRPKGLNYRDATLARDKLKITPAGSGVNVYNPTPYYINFGVFSLNNVEINEASYVAPFSNIKFSTPKVSSPSEVKYNVINDFGGASDSITHSLRNESK